MSSEDFSNTRVDSFAPLQGITVRSEEAGLVIARILAGSMIDRQGECTVKDSKEPGLR